MESAFLLAKGNTLRLHKRIGRLLSTLRIIKAHLVSAHAFSSTGDSTLSPDHDDRFARMLNDCRQLGELAMNTDADQWKQLLMDAEQIREKDQPLCNTDRQVPFLLTVKDFVVDQTLVDAFLYSRMERDAHLWLIVDEHSKAITVNPSLVLPDFGIALRSVQQDTLQRIFIDNCSEKALAIKLERHSSDRSVFHVHDQSIGINSNSLGEFEDDFTLLIDQDTTLAKVIRATVRIVQVDVKLSSEEITFGCIACHGRPMEKTIVLTNVLPCSVRVKGQLGSNETHLYRSKLSVVVVEEEFI